MKIITLTAEEREFTGFTHKIIVGFADLPAGTTVQTLQIFPKAGFFLPVGMLVTRVAFVLNTAFVSSTLATLTLSIGDVAGNTTFLAAQSILTGATPITYAAAGVTKAYTSATEAVKIAVTPTVADINTLTAGQVDIFCVIHNLNDGELAK